MEGSKWLLVLAILFVVYQMAESTPSKDPCPGDEVRLSNGQCGPCPAGSLRCGKRGPWGDDTGDEDQGDGVSGRNPEPARYCTNDEKWVRFVGCVKKGAGDKEDKVVSECGPGKTWVRFKGCISQNDDTEDDDAGESDSGIKRRPRPVPVEADDDGSDDPFAPCYVPKDAGPCRAAMERYYYDKNANICKSFTWGGCQENTNNFETMKDCRSKCVPGVLGG